MSKTFTLNGKTLAARSAVIGETLQIGIFDGDRRLWHLEILSETLADMQTQAITSGTGVADLIDIGIEDFRRLVTEGLLRL